MVLTARLKITWTTSFLEAKGNGVVQTELWHHERRDEERLHVDKLEGVLVPGIRR